MRTLLFSLLLFALPIWNAAVAGSISGTVRAESKMTNSGSAGGGKYDSRKFKFVEKVNYEEMRDFVVHIVGPVAGATNVQPVTATVDTRRILQKGAVFTPHILPVMAGATVEWPNNDEIFHNVFSMSETKPFDLGLYKNPEVKEVAFEKAGRVDVFCSIHANMNCIVLVLENPYFARADERGRYSIPGVPPGKYQLRAWHERLPAQTVEVEVPEDGDAKVDFVLGIKDLPKY